MPKPLYSTADPAGRVFSVAVILSPNALVVFREPSLSVPVDAIETAPAPVILFVPQESVPFTVRVRDAATGRLLNRDSEALEFTDQFIKLFVSVPADWLKVLPAPVKFIETGVAFVLGENVPPVWM